MSDLALASRLSFFLWSTIPDDQLLSLAEQGKLHDPKVFEQQVHRMLADPKADALVDNFAFEWLRVREVDKLDPDAVIYPSFNAELRTDFKREMESVGGQHFPRGPQRAGVADFELYTSPMSGWRATTAFRTSSATSSAA